MVGIATINSGWALVQKNVILHYGLDADQFYHDEQLDISKMTDPDYRYEVIPFNRIWHRIEQESKSANVGLTAAGFVLPTTFHAVGMAMWSSFSTADALSRFQRYSRVFHSGGELNIESTNGQYSLVISRKKNNNGVILITDIGLDCFIAALMNIFKQLSSGSFHPEKIQLTRKTPANIQQYIEFFGCPVEFDAKYDAIVITEETYFCKFPSGNLELAGVNEQAAANYLARFDNDDLVVKIQRILIENLSSGDISQQKIARQLAMSVSSLQRALKEKNTSFQQVLDNSRKELAKFYLTQGDMSLGEISYSLGFSASNNFSRAFKRWNGISPIQYRASKSK